MTRQLAAVLDAVRADRSHPTAHEVYQRVRHELPRISRGTVYRNLSKLHDERRIRVVHLAERPVRYDAVIEDHDHFVCDDCGAVHDIDASGRQETRPQLTDSGYTIDRQSITYYGACPRCSKG
jgi:Fur family peroxide stress response transcriptional regulator